MEETDPTMFLVTCHTEGCPAQIAGPEEAPFFPNESPPIWRAVCAGCGQTPELTAI
jgi:hypothetical protein